ncbi:ABC transporter ATP-binding protein [Nocardioides sp. L-11A]|uniref:ABC transporter ATP-binding protein n=1 Tax=Nocardioides sp. L-11A TaxID=3043848 RepID=UPI00249B1D04|nr:ATP-binding cassette domain-containing protein [Nocardioides sp. L-11A]
MTVLSVRDLRVEFGGGGSFRRRTPALRAVDGVGFDVAAGETLGLVGESGCGKTTTGRAVLGLVPGASGDVAIGGEVVRTANGRRNRRIPRLAQMIFQDPFSTLDPRMSVGAAVAEPLRFHRITSTVADTRRRVAELLELVGLPDSAQGKYPHQFSGGQLQRVGIARALAVEPQLLVADEPVSALDVSIQAQVMKLLRDLQQRTGISMLFVGHDLAVVKHVSHRIAVMYLGRIVEIGAASELFTTPAHPYTAALLSAVPVPDPTQERTRERIILRGDPPSPRDTRAGCAFAQRCPWARPERCHDETPALRETASGRLVACHFAEDLVPELTSV